MSHNFDCSTEEKNKEILNLRLEELFRNYNISLDLIKKTTNKEELLENILDEYINRFNEIPKTNLIAVDQDEKWSVEKEKVKSLIMFATQALMLKENSELYAALTEKNKQLHELTQKQKETNNNLKRLNSHYLNMLSFVSHELKNPIISILGFAELLADLTFGRLNEEQNDSVEVIIRVARNLINMINNYLDLAKLENGELNIKFMPLNIQKDIFDYVTSEIQEQLSKKNMEIVSVTPLPEPGFIIFGSLELLRSVVVNIISNAIKFGKSGTEIQYSVWNKMDDIEIRIRNQSFGVKKNDLELIFRKFSQLRDERYENQMHGTGLGLHLTKLIVEGHGGTIKADSDGNSWFEIIFTLPKRNISGDKALGNDFSADFYIDQIYNDSEEDIQAISNY